MKDEIDPTVKEYHDKFQLSVDYCEPYFEAATRLYKLWRGKLPDALDYTFSKVMMNAGHAIVQDRIPKYLANMFSHQGFVALEAKNPLGEMYVEQAEAWLVDLLMNPSKINIRSSIMPTLQAASVFGTGYRMPCIRHNETGDEIITSKDIDFFQILPAPTGGVVNPMDRWSDDSTPYFFYVDWMTDKQIEALSKYEGFQKDAFGKMKDTSPETRSDIDTSYYEKFKTVAGVSYGPDSEEYRRKLQDIEGKTGKRRVVHWFTRENWYIIAQDYYLIYKGDNPMGGGLLPLVKYSVTPDFKNWFGVSGLEMVEDMVIARIMNFNYRLDHLARVMFPTKWIRDDIAQGRPESDFYDRPYAVHFFPERADIRQGIHYDRAPEITNQTFIEDDRMMLYIQEIAGLPNYSKGMSGAGTLANETATGIVSLIKQAQGRLGMESMQLEYSGLAQECRLLLLLAAKNIVDPQVIRNQKAKDGFKWTTIDPDAFEDMYEVQTHGTRYIEQQETNFQKLMALYPLWNGNPAYDQYELNRQVNQVADVLPNPDAVLLPPQSPGMMGAPTEAPLMGGMASPQDMRQQTRSVANRNTVQPNTGNIVPATASI